jgi:hypothetical protein
VSATAELVAVAEGQPASVLFARLADARRAGESFEDAWPLALAAALAVVPAKWERTEWRHVLGGMAETWRAAFERWPASSKERALSLLADNTDREPAPERECEHCRGEIPEGRDTRTIYCSDKCRHAEHYSRAHAAA